MSFIMNQRPWFEFKVVPWILAFTCLYLYKKHQTTSRNLTNDLIPVTAATKTRFAGRNSNLLTTSNKFLFS